QLERELVFAIVRDGAALVIGPASAEPQKNRSNQHHRFDRHICSLSRFLSCVTSDHCVTRASCATRCTTRPDDLCKPCTSRECASCGRCKRAAHKPLEMQPYTRTRSADRSCTTCATLLLQDRLAFLPRHAFGEARHRTIVFVRKARIGDGM